MRGAPTELSRGLFFGVIRDLVEQLGEEIELPPKIFRSKQKLSVLTATRKHLTRVHM